VMAILCWAAKNSLRSTGRNILIRTIIIQIQSPDGASFIFKEK
jgi:hypothetical protein